MPTPQTHTIGPIGRLGHWTAAHFRVVAIAWAVVAVGLGVFAPRAEKALSGAGWEAPGSESVQARKLIDRNFDGAGTYGLTVVVHARDRTVSDPAFARVLRAVEARLGSDPAVTTVVPPRAGTAKEPSGSTTVNADHPGSTRPSPVDVRNPPPGQGPASDRVTAPLLPGSGARRGAAEAAGRAGRTGR